MNKNDIEYYYSPSKERERAIWADCIFVFDTSSLLEFYYFPKKSQQDIFSSTFEKIKDRLWIPHHVNFEYLKNRENTLKKPIEEKYKNLETNQVKAIENGLKNINNMINDFINHTKKEDVHPYIDNTIPLNFEEALKEFETKFIDFKEKVKIEFTKREEEINAFATDDTVLQSFSKYFEIGREYNFNKLMDIVKEGELRYRNNIPPGFKDATKKEGIQKYGDLIIWRQILDFAEQKGKPIVLITNDVKDDWCYRYKRGNEVRIERPKEDLVTEIKNKANVDFCMYTFSQFLYTAKEILETNIPQEVIEEARTTNKSSFIRFDGFYRTFDDERTGTDADELAQFEYYYRFYENGTVDFKTGVDNEVTTGSYLINGEDINIDIEYPSKGKLLFLVGNINEKYLELNYSTSYNDITGSERGLFYPDKLTKKD
jgi:hypothetical protein